MKHKIGKTDLVWWVLATLDLRGDVRKKNVESLIKTLRGSRLLVPACLQMMTRNNIQPIPAASEVLKVFRGLLGRLIIKKAGPGIAIFSLARDLKATPNEAAELVDDFYKSRKNAERADADLLTYVWLELKRQRSANGVLTVRKGPPKPLKRLQYRAAST